MKAIYITRSDISWYTRNDPIYPKALEVVSRYEATLCVPHTCRIPPEIESKAKKILRFNRVSELMRHRFQSLDLDSKTLLFTGFDFPCMNVACSLRRLRGCKWTVFCWDPPSLSHRDRFPPLRWAIDWLFRWYIRRCDHLVLNIHPGLLDEIGFGREELMDWKRSGKLELRMQDAFDNLVFPPLETDGGESFAYDIGVLSNWTRAKGGPLLVEALKRLPGKRCLWIGNPPTQTEQQRLPAEQFVFTGRLPHPDVFVKLKKCRILLVPYLPVRSLKWNYVIKIFEYLSLGRPILASDNPGNGVVAEKYPGRITLFKSGDVDDLARRLRATLSQYGV